MAFEKYLRTNVAEMAKVTQENIDYFQTNGALYTGDATLVSISQEDLDAGSPRIGDMIARNPDNTRDQWLVAEEYFKNNFKKQE